MAGFSGTSFQYGDFGGAMRGGINADAQEKSLIGYQADLQRRQLQMQLDAAARNNAADNATGLQRDTIGANTQMALADKNNAQNRYNTDLTAEGNRYATAAQKDTANYATDKQYQATRDKIDQSNSRFNSLFPLFQQSYAQGGQQVGGAPTAQPALPAASVYTPEQTQQNVNAARATIDQGTAARQQQNLAQTAGRGFGSNSPLLMALNSAAGNVGAASGADQERQIRGDAAVANSAQGLKQADLAQQQWRDYQDQDIRRRQTSVTSQNQLLQALAALA